MGPFVAGMDSPCCRTFVGVFAVLKTGARLDLKKKAESWGVVQIENLRANLVGVEQSAIAERCLRDV